MPSSPVGVVVDLQVEDLGIGRDAGRTAGVVGPARPGDQAGDRGAVVVARPRSGGSAPGLPTYVEAAPRRHPESTTATTTPSPGPSPRRPARSMRLVDVHLDQRLGCPCVVVNSRPRLLALRVILRRTPRGRAARPPRSPAATAPDADRGQLGTSRQSWSAALASRGGQSAGRRQLDALVEQLTHVSGTSGAGDVVVSQLLDGLGVQQRVRLSTRVDDTEAQAGLVVPVAGGHERPAAVLDRVDDRGSVTFSALMLVGRVLHSYHAGRPAGVIRSCAHGSRPQPGSSSSAGQLASSYVGAGLGGPGSRPRSDEELPGLAGLLTGTGV